MNGHRKPSSRAAAMAPAPAAGHNYSAANSQSHKILANRLNGSLDAGRRVPAPAPAPAPAPNHRSKGATANASFGKQLMSLNGKALSKSMDGGGGGRPFYYYARNSHVKPATPADPAAMAKDPAFVLAPLHKNAAKDPKAGYPNPSFSKSCVELKAERKTVARVKNAEKIELRSLIVEKKIAESVAESLRAKVRSVDMPCDMQVHAFRSARGALDRQTGAPFSCREVAFFLKKEFDKAYGPAWHCIVGSNFGSFVTHSVGGFLYFSIDKVSVLLFKTAVETLPEP